ncbi:MAG TPA: hypothetical protein VEO56_12490 [Bacteroidota bacterium]|nr:hypothetical protein [Bacteroidota bacterium]
MSYGTPWPHQYDMYALIPSPIADEAYGFIGGDTLEAFSPSNGAILRRTTFHENLNNSAPHQGLTPDGSVLYWFDRASNTLNRVRASDFSAYPPLSITPPQWLGSSFVVTTTRVFEAVGSGLLVCLDATTGNPVGGTWPSYGYTGVMALSPDERTLYGATGDSRLLKFDVSADSFAVTGQSSTPGVAQKIVPIDKANALGIFIPMYTVCIVDERSFALLNTITSPDLIWDACFTSTHAYVSTSNSVIEYDLRGGPTGRRWLCAESAVLVAVDRNEAILYAEIYAGGKLNAWAVPLM